MAITKTLYQLTYDELKQHTAWVAVGDYAEMEDPELSPVEFDAEGRIPGNVGEVWCLCAAVFFDGSEHLAIAMCRGDSADGPLLWSVWNGDKDVPLLLPPTPPFVLARQGPEVFATKFGTNVANVFPLTIEVVPRFAVKPEIRTVKLGISGVI